MRETRRPGIPENESYCTTGQFRRGYCPVCTPDHDPLQAAEGHHSTGPVTPAHTEHIHAEHAHAPGGSDGEPDRYHRHCGPTAITNLLRTCAMREGKLAAMPEDPCEIFERVAAIGRHRLIYMNLDLFHRFGGTLDALAGLYLQRCFREYRLHRPSLRFRIFPDERTMTRALKDGAILYLQMRGHSKYGNHHMLCYGREDFPDGRPAVYRIADGWAARPVKLTFAQLEHFRMLEVHP